LRTDIGKIGVGIGSLHAPRVTGPLSFLAWIKLARSFSFRVRHLFAAIAPLNAGPAAGLESVGIEIDAHERGRVKWAGAAAVIGETVAAILRILSFAGIVAGLAGFIALA